MSVQDKGFFSELRRRRVLQVAGAYIAIAWLVTEIVGFLLEQAGAPGWTLRLLAIVFIVGFPVATVLAWVIQRQQDGKWLVDSSRGQRRIVVAAIVLGIATTAGLSWLILPSVPEAPAYEPIPDSVAILPLVGEEDPPGVRAVGDTLLVALQEGLGRSRRLNQVTLKYDMPPANLSAFGREYRVAYLLLGRVIQAAGGLRIEMKLLDVGMDEARWSTEVNWDATRIRETGTVIANDVLETMGLETLTEKEFAGTDNRAAYDALLEGFAGQRGLTSANQLPAIEAFQRAVDLDPEYVEAYVGLAQTIYVFLFSGPPGEERRAWEQRARSAIDMALQLDARSAEAISIMGLWEDNPELKARAYRRALELDPDHEMSYFRLGMLMLQEDDLQEAERLIRKALDFFPQSANMRGDLAVVLWQQGRTEDAVAELNRAIESNPKQAGLYNKLGWMSWDPAKAIWAGRKAFELDPGRGYIASTISNWYAELGAREETIVWARYATKISPTSTAAWIAAMFAYRDISEPEAAVRCANRALDLSPGNRFALRELGSIEIAAGEIESAFGRWQNIHPWLASRHRESVIESNARTAVDFASNLWQAGELEWAHDLLTDSIDALRDDPFYLQWAYTMLGQREPALDMLESLVSDGVADAELRSWLRRPEFDLLRGDPQFQAILSRMPEFDRATSLKRVREMERNGEMPPAPGVDLPKM